METIIARSRLRMWTAFRTGSGIPMLNIAEDPEDLTRTVTIHLDEQDVVEICDVRSAGLRIDALLSTGIRLAGPLPTPALRHREQLSAFAG